MVMIDCTNLVRKWEDFTVGDSAEICKKIADSDMASWVGLTGEWKQHPLHLVGGRTTYFANSVVPEHLIVGMISAAIAKVCYGQVVLEQEIRFNKPVFVGDTVTARATVIDKVDEQRTIKLVTVAVNQHGEVVIDGFGLEYIISD